MNKKIHLVLLMVVGMSAACGLPAGDTPALPSDVVAPEATQTPVPTALPDGLHLFAPDGTVSEALVTELEILAERHGLQFNPVSVYGDLPWAENTRYVVFLWPPPDVAGIIFEHPEIQFFVLGQTIQSPNVWAVAPSDADYWRLGFAAGYTAALISPEWRLGLLYAPGEAGASLRAGYSAGRSYYCGLCPPLYPPFVTYPLVVEAPTSADTGEGSAAVNALLENRVETVVLGDGVSAEAVAARLQETNINVLGMIIGMEAVPSWWGGAVRLNQPENLGEMLAAWLDGDPAVNPKSNWRLEIHASNEQILTPGRLDAALEVLPILESGLVAP